MIKHISRSEFDALLQRNHPTCVSLYIPTDRTNADPRQNSTRFKNLVNRAITQLKQLKADKTTLAALDQACEELLADSLFWKEQEEGFVLFVAGDWSTWYTLPTTVPEVLMIADHFYVLPLMAQLDQQATFYVLELDKDDTKMWLGDQRGLTPVTVPDLPKSVTEVVGTETGERNLQFHTGTDSPKGGARAAAFHGDSSWKDDKDRYLERFLQVVDKAVVAFFKQREYPLFLSGVEELVVLYAKLSRYSALQPEFLAKIPDPAAVQTELHRRVWPMMEQLRTKEVDLACQLYHEEPRAELKLTSLPEIMRQAAQGKVAHLFVERDAMVWGTFDPVSLTPVLENTQQPRSAELYNTTARLVKNASGAIHILEQQQMPAVSAVAAILRY